MKPYEWQTIESKDELDALPDNTVLVSNLVPYEDKQAIACAQKFEGQWFIIGCLYPTEADQFRDEFFPAKVVFQL